MSENLKGLWAVVNTGTSKQICRFRPDLATKKEILEKANQRQLLHVGPVYDFYDPLVQTQEGMGKQCITTPHEFTLDASSSMYVTAINIQFFEDMSDLDRKGYTNFVFEAEKQAIGARARRAGIMPANSADIPATLPPRGLVSGR